MNIRKHMPSALGLAALGYSLQAMAMQAAAIVIGAGIVGAACAHALAQVGQRVLVRVAMLTALHSNHFAKEIQHDS